MIKGRRVVITGVGITSPLGNTLDELFANVAAGKSSCGYMHVWDQTPLKTRVGSVVTGFDEKKIPRQLRRGMSRVSQLAYDATKKAIDDSELPLALIQHERTGISYGSTMGGTSAIGKFFASTNEQLPSDMLSSTFLQIMSHTCASNLVVAFQVPGRVMASCVACAASTQAIGLGFEAIKFGSADRMICGGAEEMHTSMATVFDVLNATSTQFNKRPAETPRPFSPDRDGIVVGEGAGTFLLEEYEQAVARGAKIYAEIVAFNTNADGRHMTNPSDVGMEAVMRGALANAGLRIDDISYVNAHATGTKVGDIAESTAVYRLFRENVACSSLKGHFGHLMGACGVVESAVCLGMMKNNLLVPTLHLTQADSECAPIDYVAQLPREQEIKHILKNSFAFGGINASLVLGKVSTTV